MDDFVLRVQDITTERGYSTCGLLDIMRKQRLRVWISYYDQVERILIEQGLSFESPAGVVDKVLQEEFSK